MPRGKKSVEIDVFRIFPKQFGSLPDLSELGFQTTEELEPYRGFIGQDRAEKALRRAFSVDDHGHNIFAIESGGTGRSSSIRWYVEELVSDIKGEVQPRDWCYVYNFENSDAPVCMSFEKGYGGRFKQHIEERLLKGLRAGIPGVVAMKNLTEEQRRVFIAEDGKIGAANHALNTLVEGIHGTILHGFTFECIQDLERGVVTIQMMKISPDGKREVARRNDLNSISEEKREELEAKQNEFFQKLLQINGILEKCLSDRETLRNKIVRDNIQRVFRDLAGDIIAEFGDVQVFVFLRGLEEYTAANYEIFLPHPQSFNGYNGFSAGMANHAGGDPFLPFMVNLFVNNSEAEGPPIIHEDRPTYFNLFGKLERRGSNPFRIAEPTHMDLRAGSVSKANGGYLIISALDLFRNGGWDGLRRVLLKEELDIEDLAEQWIIPLHGLKPEPIPTKIKVILVGDDQLYHRIAGYIGAEFTQLFGIPAQFDYETALTSENINKFARLIGGWCDKGKSEDLLHLDASAFLAVMRQATRMVGNQSKISLDMRRIKNLCLEASCVARDEGSSVVSEGHVRAALADKVHRLDFVREKMYSLIKDGILLVSLDGAEVGQINGLAVYQDGAEVGQINGLAVYQLEEFSFSWPMRLTAKTFSGKGGVISIDRDVKLSGPSHNRGVLTISGYLGWKYAQDRPLSLSATIAFEQNYSGIDGDSASSAELYALLSSLSGVPLRQDIAVTGSVNQNGEIQPIGGVNEKIEGFFDVCSIFGLTGDQGVIIPESNLRHLVLREDVLETVQKGQFHIYAIKTIEEGMEILTGIKMGEAIKRGKNKGRYPKGAINYLVEKRLMELSQASSPEPA